MENSGRDVGASVNELLLKLNHWGGDSVTSKDDF